MKREHFVTDGRTQKVTPWAPVGAKNVTCCDLINVMDSLECYELFIKSQILGRDETKALVRAMETRVEIVRIGLR